MNGVSNDSLFIAGVKSVSLVDEPKKSVSMVYLQGCNFDCGFCHNASLIPMFNRKKDEMTPFKKLFETLSENFLIDGVIFTGGEPLLQPNLVEVARKLSDNFNVVGIDTNGTSPLLVEKISPFLSRIAMDIKSSFDNYKIVTRSKVNIENIKKTIEILCKRSQTKRVEFRTTYIPPFISLEDLMAVGEFLASKNFSGSGDTGSYLVLQQYIPGEGVREELKESFVTTPYEDLEIIGKKLMEYGIPVAIRSQENGYSPLI